jgi:hypothetical protein
MLGFGKLRSVLIAVYFLFAIWPRASWGQIEYGSIAGTVLDASGAAIPDATVTLTNIGTSEKRTMRSEAVGSYTFVNLLPGQYRLDAEKAGFKSFHREPIVVEIENGLRIDIPMEVGAVSESIQVTAQTPLLQPQTSSLGQVVESRTVTEMPLNGRNPIGLIQLVPGVVPQGQPSAGNSSMGNPVGANPVAAGDFSVGGGEATWSAINVDGFPLNAAYFHMVSLIPIQDAIQEFKVQTNNLGPEYGLFAGGVINFTTKSGTNAFHGSAYEFLRNSVVDSNDFFLNGAGLPVPPFTQNQFGANVGGRVIRDKLFFFSSYEGFRQRMGQALTTSVPTPAMRGGDFSSLFDPSGNVIPIYDSLSSNNCSTLAGGTTPTCRTQFAGNIIPQSRIDPSAKILTNYWPLPNGSGAPYTHINNFTTAESIGGDTDEVAERVDYNVSDKQRFFSRFSYWTLLDLPYQPFKNEPICPDRCSYTDSTKQIILGDTYTISPTAILDTHLGYERYAYTSSPLGHAGTDLTTFGMPAYMNSIVPAPRRYMPAFCVGTGSSGIDYSGGMCDPDVGTGGGIGAYDDIWYFAPSFTKVKGTHTLKIGGDFRLLRNSYFQTADSSGLYYFDQYMTSSNPLIPTGTGSTFASFLLGYGNNTSYLQIPSLMAEQLMSGSLYFGDTFQATRKLALNLGLRYDVQGSWTDRFNRLIDMYPDAVSPFSSAVSNVTNPVTGKSFGSLLGAINLVDSPARRSRGEYNVPLTNFGPRVGLAYRLNDKTVIRTGYGVFWLPVDIRWNDAPNNMFNDTYSNTWLATLDGITPNWVLSNPWPDGITYPAGRNQTWINQQGEWSSNPVVNNPYSYVQQWNFNIQRELPDGTLIDVAYAGSKGTHLPKEVQDIDQLPLADLPAPDGGPGANGYTLSQLTAQVPNPFYGLVQSGTLTSPTVQAVHLLLPYPQYDDITIAEDDDRNSTYHSLQLKVEKRFKEGGTVLAAYTVSKLISDTNEEATWLEASGPSWVDANDYNIKNEKSLDPFDVPQRFVLSYILDLPFGRGKKFAGSESRVANKIISGWGINGITTFQSGFPLVMGGAGALSGIPYAGSPRATRVGPEKAMGGSVSSRLNEWFDTSVFTPTLTYTFGSDSRTEPNLREDGVNNFDFALFKNTKFGPDEKLALQFRAEFFNLFNHPQFMPPNTNCCAPAQGGSNPSFGVVSGQYNLPRIIQFSLRFTF